MKVSIAPSSEVVDAMQKDGMGEEEKEGKLNDRGADDLLVRYLRSFFSVFLAILLVTIVVLTHKSFLRPSPVSSYRRIPSSEAQETSKLTSHLLLPLLLLLSVISF